jgi:AcrR family transcriptional regulator
MSRSSFFRYFATKEDVVLFRLEERGAVLRDALAARPEDEPIWDALRAAFDEVVRDTGHDRDRALRLGRMFAGTPSLQARHLERQARWQALLVPEVARRLGVGVDDEADPRPRALVAAAVGCLDAAVHAWQLSDGTADLGALLDRAMSALIGAPAGRAARARPGGRRG